MVRDWLRRYWRTLCGVMISALLVVVMVRLADLIDDRSGAYDARLDAALFLVSVVSVWAMMALRNWAKKHEG